ncbi:MAG: heavy metal translocating P-type ATPase [Candidatus Hydrogenedentes bacterium]|nr:heavy metal translocating P-type ATPase [Candidatus Hydrogenedentota bacterium]
MSPQSYKILGMDCAEEIAALRQTVGPLVDDADRLRFDLLSAKMTICEGAPAVDADQVIRAVSAAGLTAIPWDEAIAARAREDHETWWTRYGRGATCAISGAAAIAGLALHARSTGLLPALADASDIAPGFDSIALYAISILGGGWFVFPRAFSAARRMRADMNLLMTVAVIGAVLLGQWFEAASVAFLFSLALLMESWSVGRARNAIRALMELAPQTARVRCPHDGCEEEKSIDSVAVGAEVIVRPGERIPLDGTVEAGSTSVNQAPITGESMPVAKTVGDTVYAGTINNEGAIALRVTRAATDTTLARTIHMVEEAQSRRAKSEQWVETFARYYTPAMMALALGIAVVPPSLDGDWQRWFYEALVVLVIACPCALVISTPVSNVAGLAAAARAGVLIKGGVYLEQAGLIDAAAIDKTGTLTRGEVGVQRIVPINGHTERDVLAFAAALESNSDHPIARAIVARAHVDGVRVPPAGEVRMLAGRGIQARIDGELCWAGSHRMLHEVSADECAFHETAVLLEDAGHSVVAVGIGAKVVGFIGLADTLRENARDSVLAMKRLGVAHIQMLTGDNFRTAHDVADAVGADDFGAELLPEDKVNAVEELAKRYRTVAMIGDGVNDAPALAAAHVGIAMAAIGSDAAIETADIALMSDDLSRVPWLIGHARRARATIRQNIVFALGVKAAFLALALAGVATLWMAIAADMGASLVVIFNSLRLLRGTPSSV